MHRWLWVVAWLAPAGAGAQLPPEKQPDLPLDPAIADRLLEQMATEIADSYVFPDRVAALQKAIRAHVGTGEYRGLHSAAAFVERVTRQLQEASHDRHLRLVYYHDPQPAPGPPPAPEVAAARRAAEAAAAAEANYGFPRAEILPGNIGYLEVRSFEDPAIGGGTAVAAMNFLAHTRALIFDLRDNHGGDPGMVALILSYLFDEPTHLNDLYWRPGNFTGQFWTSGYVNGPRYPGPVYVLTSAQTFSAGEEFAYDLQAQKRATLVGAPTGGGAHPITLHRLDEHFTLLVPSGRAINPVTHGDWEGTGVQPETKVAPELALEAAHLAALEKVHAEADLVAAARAKLEAARRVPPAPASR
jgi:hypothetical protein